jgi:hypothetical protein
MGKKFMKKMTSAAALFVGAAMASQSFGAQIVPNNLYMGFENAAGGGSADYIINLGPASNLTGLIGTGMTVDLSSDFSLSLFQDSSLQGSNPSGIMGGVVGGSNAGNPSDVFLTQLRSGGSWGLPGSSAPGGLTRSSDNQAYAALSQLVTPTIGTGLLDSSRSWESDVEPNLGAGTFYGNTGMNPDSMVNPTTVLQEDLWATSNSNLTGSQPFTFEGYFTLNLTGVSPSLTFTAVPEPSSYLLAGGGGLLMLLLRSRMSRKNS